MNRVESEAASHSARKSATGPPLRVCASCLAPLALAGCASAVVVQSDFPTPLIETQPVTVGLFYEPELRDFIHAEALPRQATWTIDLGDANLAMLDPLYSTMFERTTEFSALPLAPRDAARVDAVLRSTLEEFQFDVPPSNRDQFVEVWLQYRLELTEPDGNLIVDWPVHGYGKAEIERHQENAVHRAAIVAMREAGATISTKFLEDPAVSYWLQENTNAAAIPPIPAVPDESTARNDPEL